MLKVFLVEDEYAMRERMKKNIDWQANGFCLIGEAGDGELAYSMIQELQPDILITDIHMPFMNGLELTRLVKESMPKLKIVILSGYDEFEYAKEGIRLGVTDYLLKPITSKKLLESLNKVAQLIESERRLEAQYEGFQLEKEEKIQLAKKKFFNSLISKRESVQTLIEKAKTLGLDLIGPAYNILLLKISFSGDNSLSREEDLRQTLNRNLSTQTSLTIFEGDSGDYAILIKGSNQQLIDLEAVVIEQLSELLKANSDLHYYIGVGESVNRISEIPHTFEKASKALAYRYFLTQTQVLAYADLKDYITFSSEETMQLEQVELSKLDKSELESFLYDGHLEDVSTFVNHYLKERKSNLDSYLFSQYVVMDIYFTIGSFYEKLNLTSETMQSLFAYDQTLNHILKDKKILKKTIEEWLVNCLTIRDSEDCKRYSKVVAQVQHYLQENYNKDGLSLNQVADYVNVSSSHLSTLFSQETGQTFISYLTNIRMEKAKELLRCTNLKTLEVGYEVGYKDSHYFSSLFKKTQQCTPKEYRRRTHELD